MKSFVVLTFLAALLAIAMATEEPNQQQKGAGTSSSGSFDDIVVESALSVRKPATPNRAPARPVREIPIEYLVFPQGRVLRVKRQYGGFNQPGFGGFGSSASQANAAANSQYFGPNGFGGSAANAGAQGFQSQGPLGGFGASATNAQTQAFGVGPNGFSGSAGLSGSQHYDLPGNLPDIDLNYANTYSVGPDGRPAVSNANTFNVG